jgi:flagellar M-ring protein FliF
MDEKDEWETVEVSSDDVPYEIEEEEENTYDKIKELKEKVETQLGISSNVDEEELKYDVLLERITKMVEDKTQDVAKVLENLLKEEEHQKGI